VHKIKIRTNQRVFGNIFAKQMSMGKGTKSRLAPKPILVRNWTNYTDERESPQEA